MDIVCPVAHERFSVANVNILEYRFNNCPLVPVPPHGRLIDADATDIYRREERAIDDFNDSPFSEYLDGYKDGLHEAAKCLSTTPTIIPADPAEEGET